MKLEEEMPRPAFVDLKLNRDLLDANFDGYKLSNDKFPTYVKELLINVDKVDLKDEISSQRLHIFTTHNFLHCDPWNKKSFYVVDTHWKVHRISYRITDVGQQGQPFCFEEPVQVCCIPQIAGQKVGRFNVTFKFLDQRNVLVSDGCGTMYLIETQDRSLDSESWTIVQDFQFKETSATSLDSFVLLDAVKYKTEGDNFIDALIVRVRDKDTLSEQDKHLTEVLENPYSPLLDKCSKINFVTTMSWLTLKAGSDSTSWEVRNTRSLVGTGPIRYASVELDGRGIIIASDNQFEFYYVDGKPLRYSKPRGSIKGEEELQASYLWKQTAEEITIWFRIPSSTNKSELNIQILPQKLCCAVSNQVLLEGELLHPVDQDKSRWSICESGTDSTMESTMYKRIEIILHKSELGKNWDSVNSSIFSGLLLSFGKEAKDVDIADVDIERELENLSTEKKETEIEKVYDGQQLEECDSCPSDTSSLIRIGKEDQCVTHVASLSSHQWFSSSNYGIQKPPPFCIRHDVDAIVWQPPPTVPIEATSGQSWKIEHIATFLAMGYVQASKKDRKFTVFPEDFSFVALVDAQKHVYVYCQSVGVQTELRNRKTGSKVSHVAKQFVLSIDPPLDVLGSTAIEDFLFILTTKNIHAVRVQEASSM